MLNIFFVTNSMSLQLLPRTRRQITLISRLGWDAMFFQQIRKNMNLIKEFKEFALRGNVMDLAVAVVMGAAFNKIISSLVADVVMPPLGILIGGVNFTGLKVM